MRWFLLSIIFYFPMQNFAAPKNTAAQTLVEIRKSIIKKDDLLLRLLIKRLAKQRPSFDQWFQVRKMIHQRPQVGFDYWVKWELLKPKGSAEKTEEKIATLISRSDALMLEEKYDQAFKGFQSVAKYIRKELDKGIKDNRFIYWNTIHSMSRALYGAGRYTDAIKVYDWIPTDYYKYRQVLFEKMWAGFMANRLDIAMGAIASQQSSYFADYLEPETYLVQIYILKKLCRNEELHQVERLIQEIKKKLDPKKGSYNIGEWAKSDNELSLLYQLTQKSIEPSAWANLKNKEQEIIKKSLEKRFNEEKERLNKQFDAVIAYSRLSVSMDKNIVVSDVVPDRSKLMKSAKEFWPVEDAEDCSDEIGQHLYIGKSQCESVKK